MRSSRDSSHGASPSVSPLPPGAAPGHPRMPPAHRRPRRPRRPPAPPPAIPGVRPCPCSGASLEEPPGLGLLVLGVPWALSLSTQSASVPTRLIILSSIPHAFRPLRLPEGPPPPRPTAASPRHPPLPPAPSPDPPAALSRTPFPLLHPCDLGAPEAAPSPGPECSQVPEAPGNPPSRVASPAIPTPALPLPLLLLLVPRVPRLPALLRPGPGLSRGPGRLHLWPTLPSTFFFPPFPQSSFATLLSTVCFPPQEGLWQGQCLPSACLLPHRALYCEEGRVLPPYSEGRTGECKGGTQRGVQVSPHGGECAATPLGPCPPRTASLQGSLRGKGPAFARPFDAPSMPLQCTFDAPSMPQPRYTPPRPTRLACRQAAQLCSQ